MHPLLLTEGQCTVLQDLPELGEQLSVHMHERERERVREYKYMSVKFKLSAHVHSFCCRVHDFTLIQPLG